MSRLVRETLHSFRTAMRSWRRRPAFFVIATLSLALALGICSATFSMIDVALHPMVPYADPDRTIVITKSGDETPASADEQLRALRGLAEFEALATLNQGERTNLFVGETGDETVVAQVASDFFDVLGVAPIRGRTFTDADARAGNTVVVGAALWHRQFQNRQDIGGATIMFDGSVHTIIGVVPAGVKIPLQGAEIWQPLAAANITAGQSMFVAHLRAGVTLERAQVVLSQIATRFNPDRGANKFRYVASMASGQRAHLGGGHWLMLALGTLVLLIACANLSALTLARNLTRQRDLAVRTALGARLRVLILDQIAEIALVAVAGGGLGVLLGAWGTNLYVRGMPPQFVGPGTVYEPRVSGHVLLYTLAAVLVTMMLTVLVPALRLKHIRPSDPMKDSAATTTGVAGRDLRQLVFIELAVTMMLLFVAGLFLRSAEHVGAFQLGFDPRDLRRVNGVLSRASDTLAFGTMGVERSLVARLRATSGVLGATTFFGGQWGISTANTTESLATHAPADGVTHAAVGAGALTILGIPLVAGRDIRESDLFGEGAVVIDEQLAKRLFPRGGAIGRRVQINAQFGGKWTPIVGVARAAFLDLPDAGRARNSSGGGFALTAGGPRAPRLWSIAVRLDPLVPTAARAVRELLRQSVPAPSISSVTSFSENIDAGKRASSFFTYVFSVLALSGLALAAVGVLGVVSYSVSQRMREFGVRIALGAQPAAIHRLVLGDGLRMGALSVAVGGMAGVWFGTLFSRALFDVPAVDAMSFVRAAIVLVLATVGASLVPAIRASRSNPLDILRAT